MSGVPRWTCTPLPPLSPSAQVPSPALLLLTSTSTLLETTTGENWGRKIGKGTRGIWPPAPRVATAGFPSKLSHRRTLGWIRVPTAYPRMHPGSQSRGRSLHLWGADVAILTTTKHDVGCLGSAGGGGRRAGGRGHEGAQAPKRQGTEAHPSTKAPRGTKAPRHQDTEAPRR